MENAGKGTFLAANHRSAGINEEVGVYSLSYETFIEVAPFAHESPGPLRRDFFLSSWIYSPPPQFVDRNARMC